MSQRMPPVQYIMTGVSPGRPRSGAGTAPPAASVGVWQKWSCKTIKQLSRPGNAQLVAALATLWANVRPRADTPQEQACALANLETAMPRTLAERPQVGAPPADAPSPQSAPRPTHTRCGHPAPRAPAAPIRLRAPLPRAAAPRGPRRRRPPRPPAPAPHRGASPATRWAPAAVRAPARAGPPAAPAGPVCQARCNSLMRASRGAPRAYALNGTRRPPPLAAPMKPSRSSRREAACPAPGRQHACSGERRPRLPRTLHTEWVPDRGRPACMPLLGLRAGRRRLHRLRAPAAHLRVRHRQAGHAARQRHQVRPELQAQPRELVPVDRLRRPAQPLRRPAAAVQAAVQALGLGGSLTSHAFRGAPGANLLSKSQTCTSQAHGFSQTAGAHLEAWLLADPLSVRVRRPRLAAVLRIDALRGQVDAAAQLGPRVAHPAEMLPQRLPRRAQAVSVPRLVLVLCWSCTGERARLSAGHVERRRDTQPAAHLEGLLQAGQVVEVHDAELVGLRRGAWRAVAAMAARALRFAAAPALLGARRGSLCGRSLASARAAGRAPAKQPSANEPVPAGGAAAAAKRLALLLSSLAQAGAAHPLLHSWADIVHETQPRGQLGAMPGCRRRRKAYPGLHCFLPSQCSTCQPWKGFPDRLCLASLAISLLGSRLSRRNAELCIPLEGVNWGCSKIPQLGGHWQLA